MRFTKLSAIAAPVTAVSLLFCMGNTSCGSSTQHGISGVVVGNTVAGAPIGIVYRPGADYRKTIWATGLLTAATIAAAEQARHTMHLVVSSSNELSTSPRDPCKDQPDKQIMVSWRELRLGRSFYINCEGWRRIWRGAEPAVRNVQILLKCVEYVLINGLVSSGAEGVIYQIAQSSAEVAFAGRVMSAFSKNWAACAANA